MITVKKAIILVSVFFISISIVNAQDDQLPAPSSNPRPEILQLPLKENFKTRSERRRAQLSKYTIEPNIVFSSLFGGFNAGISPYVGHQLWKNLYGGGGVTYVYTSFNNLALEDAIGNTHLTNAHWNTYGAGVFLQYNIWKGFFIRDRFEVLHRDIADVYNASLAYNSQTNSYSIEIPKIQRNIPDMLIGVGYNLLENKHFFMPIAISYNVLSSATNKYYAVYPNAWVMQFGFVEVF